LGNVFVVWLKKFYRDISALETRILDEDLDDDVHAEGIIILRG